MALRAFRSSPYPKQCCPLLSVQHPLLVADASVWDTFLLGVACRHILYGFYLFFLPVRMPFEIRKLPPDPPVRGFPVVWRLPLLSLPSLDVSPSLTLSSVFLSFVLPPFKDSGLLFWERDVCCWRSEVVLCSLLCV